MGWSNTTWVFAVWAFFMVLGYAALRRGSWFGLVWAAILSVGLFAGIVLAMFTGVVDPVVLRVWYYLLAGVLLAAIVAFFLRSRV
jgi:hypothetical protein